MTSHVVDFRFLVVSHRATRYTSRVEFCRFGLCAPPPLPGLSRWAARQRSATSFLPCGTRVAAVFELGQATVWSNFFDIVEVDPKWRSVPYGRPIWNHQRLSWCEKGVGMFLFVQMSCKCRAKRYYKSLLLRYYVLDETASVATSALPGMAGQLHIAGEGARAAVQ